MQHSSLAGPGQRPGVEVRPREAHVEVLMQIPETPPALHDGGGVQHSSLAGPGQWPAVDV